MLKLGVNVDHVATLREARRVSYPDPLEAAMAAVKAGADAITLHVREDRRHIQDADLFRIREAISVHLNQELAPTDGMVELALRVRPNEVCIVPERREELTTEGGLDAAGLSDRLGPIIERLRAAHIGVSLFIEPDRKQVEAAARLGADFIELHTGTYANIRERELANQPRAAREAQPGQQASAELDKIREAVRIARSLKLKPNAGHGLNYRNVGPIAAIPGVRWLHIGHAIVARAVMVGMERAVREMKVLMARAPAQGAKRAAPRRR